jgi:pyruvyl transferase EpsO
MERLASANGEWLDPLLAGRSVLFVDQPTHFNIGDHLIMLGTEHYLASRKLQVVGRRAPFQPLPALAPDTVVLCQGGGNFGDIYGVEQRFREALVTRYPRNRIVILPQTIHFHDRANQAKSSSLLRAHADLHLAVRDSASQVIAADMGLDTVLMPDMAHHLYPFHPHLHVGKGVLVHARRDVEQKASHAPGSFDWDDVTAEHRLRNDLSKRWLRLSRFGLPWPSPDRAMAHWMRNSRLLCAEAASRYAAYERIVTDRLHGHILACLMDLPSTAGDNSYGKVHAYVRQWTGTSPLVRMAEPAGA